VLKSCARRSNLRLAHNVLLHSDVLLFPDPRKSRGFTLIELMIVVGILGLLASIAVPAMTKFLRRSKTSEARVNLAKLFDGTATFFSAEHAERGEVETISLGGAVVDLATHRCPYRTGEMVGATQAGITPAANFNCNAGVGAHCIPAAGGGGAGYYDITLWSDNEVWNGLGFTMEQGHFFHYNYIANNAATGYGQCQFTAQAFADLDDDLTFSTYERSGAADQAGINASIGLFIDNPVE